MRLLGLSCGQQGGSSELLLKAALIAAEERGLEVEHVRLADLRIPIGPTSDEADDSDWFLERYLEADALIASTPIYTRALPGELKVLLDRVLGPKLDVVLTQDALARQESGAASSPLGFNITADPRVLRSRVAGLITVGCREPQWRTLALPLLHTLTFSTQVAVVDQIEVRSPGGVGGGVTDRAALERAAALGHAVAEQAGVPYDEARYLGDPGTCPVCHLDVVVLRRDHVECGTCGARGRFVAEGDRVTVDFSPEGIAKSIFTIAEKRSHQAELDSSAAGEPGHEEIERATAVFHDYDRVIRPSTGSATGGAQR